MVYINIFQRLFRRRLPEGAQRVEVLSGGAPTFTPWGGDAYANDIYRGAVDAIARNAAKLKGSHVVRYGDHSKIEGNCKLNRLLQVSPNPYMSGFDLLYKLVTHYFLFNSAFAFLQRDDRDQLAGIFPLCPLHADFLADAAGTLYCKFLFDGGREAVLPYADIIHLRRKSDLYFKLTFSKFQPLGKNSDTLDGLNSHLVIMDELHSIKDRNLYEVMKQSQSARRQPLLIMITTAGTVRECIFDDMYKYACGVADGTIADSSFLPVLYELDDRSEWLEPMAWEKANPGLNRIKKLDDLMGKVERAKNSPRDLTGVLVKDFNVISTVGRAWLTFDDINNTETFDITAFKGMYAIGGTDLSITTDLTCATLLLMDKAEKRYVVQMYWLPAENFEARVHEEKIPYDKWLEAGQLRLCAGNSINYSDVTAWFLEMVNQYDITPAWIYYDSYSAKYWVQEMQDNGFNMVRCIQGAKTLSLPMQMLGADLKGKKINYNNSSLLKWCLTNTGVQEDRNGNIVPIKAQSPKYRIDGTASLLDAYVGLYEHFNEFLNAL